MAHPGLVAIAAAAFLAATCVLVLFATAEVSPLSFVAKAAHAAVNLKSNGKSFAAPRPLGQGIINKTPEMKNAIKTRLAVPYGTDSKTQVLNFWEAPGDGARPLVIMIHGGGWHNGDYREFPVHGFINQGISYASVEYRMLNEVSLPGPVMDAARALQFLKHNAAEYNIDPAKIILTGHSAGGLSALYLNYHDDLADPNNADPVLRESTRVLASAVKSAQTSIDPEVVGKWGMGKSIVEHVMLHDSVGLVAKGGMTATQKALHKEFSPINHVDSKDPPVFDTTVGDTSLPCKDIKDCIHHHEFAHRLKMKADSLGAQVYIEHHENERKVGKFLQTGDKIEKAKNGKDFASPMEFILDQFGAFPPPIIFDTTLPRAHCCCLWAA